LKKKRNKIPCKTGEHKKKPQQPFKNECKHGFFCSKNPMKKKEKIPRVTISTFKKKKKWEKISQFLKG
jgi:hypothetical protein